MKADIQSAIDAEIKKVDEMTASKEVDIMKV